MSVIAPPLERPRGRVPRPVLLAIAADTIEEAAEDRHRRLRALSIYARMAEAIVPVAPVRLCQERAGQRRAEVVGVRQLQRLKVNYFAGNFSWLS